MDIKLKHRLVGACVILALAVFFLPMILDSEKYNQNIKSEIPEQPVLDIQGQESDEGSLTINLDEDEPAKAIKSQPKVTNATPAKEPIQEQGETSKSGPPKDSAVNKSLDNVKPKDAGQKQNTTNKSVSENKQQDQEGAGGSDEAEKQTPVEKTTAEKVEQQKVPNETGNENKPQFTETAWVIQIGSFSNKENASALVAELRNKGFRAYQRDAEKYTRVFVGPYPDKAAANSRIEGLENIVGAAVKVIEFDPQDH